MEQLADAEERVRYRREIIVNALIFIAGFSSVFIAFGASASLIGQALMTQSPWQPALYLLSAEGAQLRSGSVHRAGVAAVLPTTLEPGTYYLVVDSSVREWSRGDGLYRLYVGWNRSLLGSMEMGRLGGD